MVKVLVLVPVLVVPDMALISRAGWELSTLNRHRASLQLLFVNSASGVLLWIVWALRQGASAVDITPMDYSRLQVCDLFVIAFEISP